MPTDARDTRGDTAASPHDLAEQCRQSKLRLEVALRVLRALSASAADEEAIQGILRALQRSLGFEAVGIRLRKGDDFPYYAVSGFSDDFVKVESCLCSRDAAGAPVRDAAGNPVLECTCGAVLRGDIDRSLPFVTPGGSVWVNDAAALSEIESLTLKKTLTNFRGTCITRGFRSVALIPLRSGDTTVGLLQINDRRKDMFTLDLIRFFEELGASVGVALSWRETRQALQDSRLFLDSIIENIPDMIFVKDAKDLAFVLLNRAGEDLLGTDRRNLLGKSDYDLFPREQADFFTAKDRQTLAGDRVTDIPEEPIETGGKGRRFLHTKKFPLKGPDGRPKYLLGISEDITEAKQAEATRDRLAAIVASSDDAIISKTLDGVITTWNHGAETIYGYAADEAVGRNISMLATPDRQDEVPRLLEKIRSGEHIDHFETVRQAKDGRRIAVSLTISPLRDGTGRVVGVSTIARDVTVRKQAEEKLREVAEMKAGFAAMVSHELRTPLATVGMALDTVRELGALNLQQAQFLDAAKRNMERILRLVSQVLDFRRLDAEGLTLDLKPQDINEAVSESVEGLQLLAKEKGLELAFEPARQPLQVACDKDRIAQIVTNLIGNAVKFSRRGRITVRTGLVDGRVRVSVRDEGPGIKEEDKSKLFRSFVRLPSTDRRIEGAGLGLAISRKIVEAHGGEIGVDSAYGDGATFYFVLPAAA